MAAKQLPAISFSLKPPPCLRAALHACACVRACACVAYAALYGSVAQSCLFYSPHPRPCFKSVPGLECSPAYTWNHPGESSYVCTPQSATYAWLPSPTPTALCQPSSHQWHLREGSGKLRTDQILRAAKTSRCAHFMWL